MDAIEPALMINSIPYLAPLALLLPAYAASVPLPTSPAGHIQTGAGAVALTAQAATAGQQAASALNANDPTAAPLRVLDGAHVPKPLNQVRIERRVIIRISPSSQVQRERMLAALPRRPITTTYAEVEHGDCVPIEQIAGVHAVEDHRLLLFLRDRRVLSAALGRSCTASAFYSGFYVERSEDGKLCVSRDRLRSRSGASCQLDALHRLVAIRN